MTASGVFSNFLYRSDSFGKYNECGVGVFETVSSKSSLSASLDVGELDVCASAYGEVGDTTSSCQLFFGVVTPCLGFMGPVGVIMVEDAGTEELAMFWKT